MLHINENSFYNTKEQQETSSAFRFNFISSFIYYIVINCISYSMYLIFLWEEWSQTVPFTIGQLFSLELSNNTFRIVIAIVFLVPIFTSWFVGTKLKQLKSLKASCLSVCGGFMVGFLMLNIATIFNMQNEVLDFMLKIPAGWVLFLYFDGSIIGEIMWNFFVAIGPIFCIWIGLFTQKEKLYIKEREQKETIKNSESDAEPQKKWE